MHSPMARSDGDSEDVSRWRTHLSKDERERSDYRPSARDQ